MHITQIKKTIYLTQRLHLTPMMMMIELLSIITKTVLFTNIVIEMYVTLISKVYNTFTNDKDGSSSNDDKELNRNRTFH